MKRRKLMRSLLFIPLSRQKALSEAFSLLLLAVIFCMADEIQTVTGGLVRKSLNFWQ